MQKAGRKHGLSHLALVGIVLVSAFAALAGCAGEPEVTADLVLRNGKVVTVDEAVPDGEAIALHGDTILAVGSDEEISRYVGNDTDLLHLHDSLIFHLLQLPGQFRSGYLASPPPVPYTQAILR